MTSVSSHFKLANLLKTIAEGEKHAEISRQVLAERDKFEPYSVFTRLDRDADGLISIDEILEFFYDNNTEVTKSDIETFVRSFSATNCNKLCYPEFLSLVLPRADYDLRQIAIKRQTCPVPEYKVLTLDLEIALLKVLNREVQLSRKIEVLKEDLVSNCDFSLKEAFNSFDKKGNGFVDFDCIKNFFKIHCLFITEDDILNLLNRADFDNDCVLNYKEFAKMILPTASFSSSNTELYKPINKSVSQDLVTKKNNNQDYFSTLSNSTRSTFRDSKIKDDFSSPQRSSTFNNSFEGYNSGRSLRIGQLSSRKDTYQNESKPDLLVFVLKKQLELEEELSKWKNQLSLQKDFNLFDAFRLLDKHEKGHVDSSEFKTGLNELGIYASKEEIDLLFKKVKDVVLRYGDFCDLIVPLEGLYANILSRRRPTYTQQEELGRTFSVETKEILKRTLQILLVNELYSEYLRQRLNREPFVKVWEAFQFVSKGRKEGINVDDFRDLLNKYNVFASEKELCSLINKYDKDQDGKVTFEEFVEEVKPRSYRRIYLN